MNKISKLLAVLLLFVTALPLWAQSRVVTGTVKDQNNQLLIGVNVKIKDSSHGTITDFDGNFKLELDEGATTLEFSYIGYKSEVVEVGTQSHFDIVMTEDAEQLEEVVVTALGIKRDKKAVGYAMQQVGGEEITTVAAASPFSALSGKIAGMDVSTSGSGAAGSTSIRIRGANSLSSSNEALIVIDGVPMENSGGSGAGAFGGFDYGSNINNINAEDIESINVLKGGAAAALYGSRGLNGVVMITTKKGSKNDQLKVTYNANYTWERPNVVPEFQNQYAQGSGGKYLATSVNGWGPKMTGQQVTNFLGETQTLMTNNENPVGDFFRTGSTFNNTVSVSKSGENNTVYFSATHMKNQGIMPNAELERLSLNLRATSKLTDYLTMDSKVNIINQDVFNRPNLGGSPDNPMYTLSQMPRSVSLDQLQVYQTNSGLPVMYNTNYRMEGGYPVWAGTGSFPFASNPLMQNPYWAVNENTNQDVRNRIIAFTELDLDIKKLLVGVPLDNFSLKTRASIDYTMDERERHTADQTLYKPAGLATINYSKSNFSEVNYDAFLSGLKSFGDFGFSFMAGGNLRYNKSNGYASSSQSGIVDPNLGYILQNFNNVITSQSITEKTMQSLFGTLTFDYKDQLFLNFNMRNDWTSALAPGYWSFYYPSVDLSWIISEAVNLPEAVNMMKVRASYAEVGNDLGPHSIFYSFATNPNQYYGLPYGGIPSSKPLYELQPERARSIDFGLETHFFDDRIILDVAYYQTSTDNQIFYAPLPPSSGYNTGLTNAGLVMNQGLEIALNTDIVRTNDFTWQMNVNASRNWSEVLELTEGVPVLNSFAAGGAMIQHQAGQPLGQIVGTAYMRDENGTIMLDEQNLPMYQLTEDGAMNEQVTIGNSVPKWILGINNSFRYKQFSLNVAIDGKFGYDMFSYTNLVGNQRGTLATSVDGRDGWYESEALRAQANVPSNSWTPTGGMKVTGVNQEGQAVEAYVDPQLYYDRLSNITEAYVYDASYLRLQQVSLGYTFPNKMLESTPFRNVTFSAVGQNLFYLYSNVPNVSPNSTVATNNAGGIEIFAFPETASYGFNLKVEF
ncbi:SusC/RagA family TonB-linked outer membrane protein [Sediminitomix flava]|uniref:TonB-linked SusC/RagA family outer membrane protein n=1 Tax=Sediminitomix flava TaxID=379075 RepID=A0A315ZF59_SEDFL|nr:SusC/RagA family TonB-linked outer membrane protein [Sediminitomix flava]PWJ43813.1 TonB-linked SusC/RagA family outer membrane protein [Sediminitomix flava]